MNSNDGFIQEYNSTWVCLNTSARSLIVTQQCSENVYTFVHMCNSLFQMVYLVSVLPTPKLFVIGERLVFQNLHSIAPASFSLAGLSNRVQLSDLVFLDSEGQHYLTERGVQDEGIMTKRGVQGEDIQTKRGVQGEGITTKRGVKGDMRVL